PLIGVEHFGRELRREIRVLKLPAVDPLVKGARLAPDPRVVGSRVGGARPAEGFPVPLGVLTLGRERRYRKNPPVNEDAELGVAPPLRRWPAVDGIPRGVVVFCRRLGRL